MSTETGGTSGNDWVEHIKVEGHQLVAKVKELIHEGNVRHIVISHDGHKVLELPITAGFVAVVLAPALAAVAALGAALANCTLDVTRTTE